MRAAPLVAGLLLVASASPILAQTAECAAYVSNAQRVCAAAVDGTRAFHPVIGVLISGGNPTIGSAGALGGLGHASVTLRANAVELVLPELDYDGSNTAVPAGDKFWAPAPMVEGALGIYKGMGCGPSGGRPAWLGPAPSYRPDRQHDGAMRAPGRSVISLLVSVTEPG